MASRTHDGRALKLLTVLDEHTRECLAIVVARKIRSHDVLEVLADLFVLGPEDWVLPSPADPGRPCSRNIMRDWWNRTQSQAGLGHIDRLGWHSLRRKFANELRHVPLKDLASLGGWKDTQTLLKCYLKEDEEAMVQALESRRSPHARHLFGGKRGTEDPAA